MSGLIRFLFYVLIAYLIYLLVRFLFSPRKRPHAASSGRKPSGVMVKDEICNTYLPEEDAIRERVGGKDYFFCSKNCRQKFLDQGKKTAERSGD